MIFLEFYGTIGPACAQLETLQRMVEAGMTGIRMNLSHGPLSAHKDWLDIIHAVGIPQLLIDLQGPELRIGTLPQPLVLEPGQSLRLGQGGVPCPAALVHAARPGQNLLLDDGRLLVQVAEADGAALQCTVVRGGTLQSRKSLAAPGLTVASPTLTEEDLQNLQLAGACGVTGVMLPFVRGAEDIRTLRRNAAALGRPMCLATESRLAANGTDADLADYCAIAKIPVPIAEDFDALAAGKVYQIMIGGRAEEYGRLMQDVHGAKIAAWWDRAMDIIPTAGGKGTGIAHVLAAYGIDKADAMAFGDGNNDLEMFGAVGTGVAMANGSDALKAAATDICGACAEDGIHHYCVEHGLIEA